MDDFYIFLFSVTLFHCSICFFDIFFKTCSHVPYLSLLKNTGLQIKPFRIHWYTTAFNRLIQKWGSFRPKLQLAWFSAGTWMTVLLMPVATALLIRSIVITIKQSVQEDNSLTSNVATLQPVVPGMNMPISEIGYYMFTLVLCSVFHEIGHAFAAVREDARVAGIGLMFMFIVPVAYVSLEQVELLAPTKQLRILCAGVWHNLVLSVVSALLVFMLPWIVLPLYDWGNAIQIQHVDSNSPVYGPAGLMVDDQVTLINDCPVLDFGSWQDCLAQSVRLPNPGYCVHSEFIKEHDESVPAKHLAAGAVECCTSNSPRHLCFEYLENEAEPLELPQYSCLNARTVIEVATQMCYKANDCSPGLHCFRPSLENSTKLLRIKRKTGNIVLFLGHPAEIYHTVVVSDYINLYSLFPSYLPERLKTLAEYTSTFSAGLAILNVIPCFYFDGQHIIRALIDAFFSKKIIHSSVRHAISLCITFVGTFILAFYLGTTIWSSFW